MLYKSEMKMAQGSYSTLIHFIGLRTNFANSSSFFCLVLFCFVTLNTHIAHLVFQLGLQLMVLSPLLAVVVFLGCYMLLKEVKQNVLYLELVTVGIRTIWASPFCS